MISENYSQQQYFLWNFQRLEKYCKSQQKLNYHCMFLEIIISFFNSSKNLSSNSKELWQIFV